MKTLTALLFLAFSVNSFADQCEVVTAQTAKTATKLISLSKKNAGGVLVFCQPCGDKEPSAEIRVNQIDIVKTYSQELSSEVHVNGEAIDLAYTYVNISPNTWVNLATLSKCDASGVSQFILSKTAKDGSVKYVPSAKY